jgi:hypothetical protein
MDVTGSTPTVTVPRLPPPMEALGVMPPLAALGTAASAARAHVRSTLASWEMGHLTEPTVAVVSELVANAVNASADELGRPLYRDGGILMIWVRLHARGPTILTEVWDQAPGVPVLRDADGKAESGRGLMMVRELSGAWGWYPLRRQPGKCVWAEITDPGGHVRNVPQLLTIVTSPSASMRRSAVTTVARDTPYSAASSATEGSRSCGCHSPPLIRARSAASTRWLGSSGVRSAGIQP